VRGKKILLLSLIAMFLSVMIVGNNPALAVPRTHIYIAPALIPGPGETGNVGDEFLMACKIDNAADVAAVQVTIGYAPYVSVLTASEFTEGDFMSNDGNPTLFFYTVDAFQGTFTVVIVRSGGIGNPGANGEGTLFTWKFKVIEAGSCAIPIVSSILLNSNGSPIGHYNTGAFYNGNTASLIRVNLPDGRKVKAGDTFTICPKVRNDGDDPLIVRVRLDISRLEDGRQIQIRSGQTYTGGGLGEPLPYTYLYVDEFNEWYYEWNNDPTNLFGIPDGSYIEGDAHAEWASLYSFEAIALGGKEIAEITLEGYTQYPNGATEAVDIDVYDVTAGFAWWGSLYGTPSWDWHGVRWTSDSVLATCPYLANETNLNNVQVLVYNYHGDAPDVIRLDSMRLKVEFAAITPVIPEEYEILPGEELELDCITWLSDVDHVGSYELTATIEYTEDGFSWNSWESQQKTLNFWIVP
jgi:hypothetical protein